jgi:hypothetical protein
MFAKQELRRYCVPKETLGTGKDTPYGIVYKQ